MWHYFSPGLSITFKSFTSLHTCNLTASYCPPIHPSNDSLLNMWHLSYPHFLQAAMANCWHHQFLLFSPLRKTLAVEHCLLLLAPRKLMASLEATEFVLHTSPFFFCLSLTWPALYHLFFLHHCCSWTAEKKVPWSSVRNEKPLCTISLD